MNSTELLSQTPSTLMIGSFAVWPLLILLLVWYRRAETDRSRFWLGLLAVFCIAFIYMRFVERYWIIDKYVALDRDWDARVVLIADQHLGAFKGDAYMERVVEHINSIPEVDFVVIAGDFVYSARDLQTEHAALAKIQVPTYAVLGNHDVVTKREKEALSETLTDLGVTVLENEIVTMAGVTIYGLGSHVTHEDDVTLLAQANPSEENILILTHNPDTTLQPYPDVDITNSVTLTGHTHCGQIRIPWLYKHIIPTTGDFPDRGPYDLGKKGTLLITCGLGEVLLPLRLFNPPEIMVIDL